MRRIRLSMAALIIAASLCAGRAGGQNTVPGFKYQTEDYRLVMFSAGHFALDVGGIWLPGCVCLNVNGVPQYKTDRLSQMRATVTRSASGRRPVINGHLTDGVAFTETLAAGADRVDLTYTVGSLTTTATSCGWECPRARRSKGWGPIVCSARSPAETQVVMPLLYRGEVLRVKIHAPAEICDYRFGVYFRGLWFQSADAKAADLRLTAVITTSPFIRAAMYWNERSAIVVLANSQSSSTADFSVTIRPDAFGWPRRCAALSRALYDR